MQIEVRNTLYPNMFYCFHSLIIASKYDPLPILTQALTLLVSGCPFVVYHEYLEPLVLCYNYLILNELAIRIVLADTWKRQFQVLPGRTHPSMYMSASGGFLLYGTYVGTVGVDKVDPPVLNDVNGAGVDSGQV